MHRHDWLTSVLQCITTFLSIQVIQSQETQPLCKNRSCYPATGNLLVGREENLYASSTCGLKRRERYCVVGDVRETKKCFTCDSRRPWAENNPNSHNISNIVTTFSRDRLRRWWQAENGEENVTIQLDLDAEFHFTHLIITFKTFRPKAMFIERSLDFGINWVPYRYFAEDCKESFPDIPTGTITSLDETVICEERYSNVLPASRGEIVFKVLPPHMKIPDPYSKSVQDLLKLTNLRVIFKELHTLGDDLLDLRKEINEKYYYSIYDMVVRGSCSCYGHASKCVPSKEGDSNVENMVHSKCECTHNTKGANCDRCMDFYNDRPWMPARAKETNECRRCECHNHATSCHFDPAVYHSRGNVSGGVCDNCMHNTDGTNCETCKSHFYQDPTRDLRDPEICQQCDCDPTGTLNNGECDMRTDAQNGLVAGRCKCKQNVGGARCQRCQAGFWNLNELGCEECECNLLGTRGNEGCDQYSGDCLCKRYVVGRNCDQCALQYWGLSKEVDGCKACDCDVGGSVDNNCDQVTGQCACHPGINGRQCNQAIPGYFVTDLDYLRYEAESASATGQAFVVIREEVPGYPVTWTGDGFMRMYEGDTLEFTVRDIPYGQNYELVIRYDPQMPGDWEDVRVAIVRPSIPDPDGPCGNGIPQEDYKAARLSATDRHYVVTPEICFEQGKTYYIRLEFEDYQVGQETPVATILIDSISLVPVIREAPVRIDTTPIPIGDLVYCHDLEMDSVGLTPTEIPQRCLEMGFSIGAAIQRKALMCECNPTGSSSTICDNYGGQCKCKPNVTGRKCDGCAPGTYGFGPQGCTLCNCHAQGSRDNFCDVLTGNCLCTRNINGRACDRCDRGMYNFPNCQHCECNGHADECDDGTGVCLGCRDLTTGPNCDQCEYGYYGDPSLGSGIHCTACMCPGGTGSGYQHAETCSLDPLSLTQKCDCPSQFAGDDCGSCAENHYGSPREENGTCTSCLEGCNYNIDMSIPGSCDAVNGSCLLCQYDTDGDSCEFCASGFYGDATEHSCTMCICNPLGSDRNADEICDRFTGQCPCLPNVIGENCDQCEVDHWKLASGVGCEACDCDPEGSTSSQCNEFDGQCACVDGRGGRKCDQCIALQWGDPEIECMECNCHPDGSMSMQCDHETGQCPCHEGITGMNCDRCDRGTTGTLPNCVPCGQCFDDWDAIIRELRVETDKLLARVNITKTEGAVGVYDQDFMAMEKTLDEVKNIVDGFNQTAADMSSMEKAFDQLRMKLMEADSDLKNLTTLYSKANGDLAMAGNSINVLENSIAALLKFAEEQKEAVDVQIQQDINGAFNTIQANEKRSRDALERAELTDELLTEATNLQNQTKEFLISSEDEFNRQHSENEKALEDARDQADNLAEIVRTDINKEVCAQPSPLDDGEYCHTSCGGGGCSTCGEGDSCSDGAQGKSRSAHDLAEITDGIVQTKAEKAGAELEKLESALEEADNALTEAQMAFDFTMEVMEKAQNASTNMTEMVELITSFLSIDKATPEEVEQVANEVLNLSIPMSQNDITELAIQINETIQNLTNIDQILNETAADLATSEALKTRADNASDTAAQILEQVTELNRKLSDARRAQNSSQEAIGKAFADIGETRDTLTMIGQVTSAAVDKSQRLLGEAHRLFERVKEAVTQNAENGLNLAKAEKLAGLAKESAAQATEDAAKIKTDYEGKSAELARQFNDSESAARRTDELLLKASLLASNLSSKKSSLEQMEDQFDKNEQQMDDLSKQIAKLLKQMEGHLEELNRLDTLHNTCEAVNPASTTSSP